MKYSRYLLACIPAVLCVYGNLSGGLPSMYNIIYSMMFLPLTEWFIPDNSAQSKEDTHSFFPTFILILLSFCNLLVTVSLVYGIYTSRLSGVFIVLAAISSGINAGTNGIVVAHELIHRKELYLRILGIINMIQVNYGHFYIEHIKGHHKYAGTQADPATAKYGENIYKFIFRTIPGQLLSSFMIERKRLFDQHKSQIRNFVLLITGLELVILAALYFIFGYKILLACLIYSIIGIFLLEYVNYIEHYGLKRDEDKKFEAHHAWQSNKAISRISLIELSRHADHHMKASKPYHTLNSHPGYFLPSGYYGMFYIALVPVLWFKIINPLIDADKHKFN